MPLLKPFSWNSNCFPVTMGPYRSGLCIFLQNSFLLASFILLTLLQLHWPFYCYKICQIDSNLRAFNLWHHCLSHFPHQSIVVLCVNLLSEYLRTDVGMERKERATSQKIPRHYSKINCTSHIFKSGFSLLSGSVNFPYEQVIKREKVGQNGLLRFRGSKESRSLSGYPG